MKNLQVVEADGQRVLTTEQIAKEYGVEEWQIRQNHKNNKKRYVAGKHYIALDGAELRAFKDKVENIYLVGKNAKILYLWTEKGALLHAKSINTDKAWEVYDYLVDFYFRAKDGLRQQASQQESKERGRLVVDAPENIQIIEGAKKVKDDLICLQVLLEQCNMFVSMEEYKRRRQHALDAVDIIRADMLRFSVLDPRMVRKVY
ncbi:MAG: ORF6N domain-containing protein [Lachnospiraceae bacterium]|nr:ORF6N domain-containing protein [Lachnospiraceae bacterium]